MAYREGLEAPCWLLTLVLVAVIFFLLAYKESLQRVPSARAKMNYTADTLVVHLTQQEQMLDFSTNFYVPNGKCMYLRSVSARGVDYPNHLMLVFTSPNNTFPLPTMQSNLVTLAGNAFAVSVLAADSLQTFADPIPFEWVRYIKFQSRLAVFDQAGTPATFDTITLIFDIY